MLLTIKKKIQQDKLYKKFQHIVDLNIERINPTNLMDEIRDVAEIRAKTSLVNLARQNLLEKLIDENLRAQGHRSRLSEICVQCSRVRAKLQSACEKMKDHVNVTYSEDIRSSGRTKDERAIVINSLVHSALEFIKNLDAVVHMAEIVIVDIDKQHYSLKLTVDALNLHVHKEQLL